MIKVQKRKKNEWGVFLLSLISLLFASFKPSGFSSSKSLNFTTYKGVFSFSFLSFPYNAPSKFPSTEARNRQFWRIYRAFCPLFRKVNNSANKKIFIFFLEPDGSTHTKDDPLKGAVAFFSVLYFIFLSSFS